MKTSAETRQERATKLRLEIDAAAVDHPDVARLWSTVFEAPTESEPDPGERPNVRKGPKLQEWETLTAQRSVWHVKTNRAGQLHPDAAADLSPILKALGIDAEPTAIAEAKIAE